jgi:sulfoxide reductase heme-binding subunit YedZ
MTTTFSRVTQSNPRITRADLWMAGDIRLGPVRLKRQTFCLFWLRAVVLVPLAFMFRAFIDLNVDTLQGSVADTLGTGAEVSLLLCLLVTPAVTITGWRWIIPLRRWYGIVFAVTALTDATTASITTTFAGGVAGRVAGHTFLLVGLTMALIALPLLLTANNWAQRWLGRYWKALQRMTYVIWGLLFVHLALLEGFGFQSGANGSGDGFSVNGHLRPDGDPVFHQRLYQLTACSIFLLVLRLPPVRRWVKGKQKAGENWKVYAVVLPLFALFVVGFSFMVNEELFKGIDSLRLTPSTE